MHDHIGMIMRITREYSGNLNIIIVMKAISLFLGLILAMPILTFGHAVSDNTSPSSESSNEAVADHQEINLYTFEYQVLPVLASYLPPQPESIALLSRPEFATDSLGIKVDLAPCDIAVTVVGEGDERAVVWTMPEPPKVPLAQYIAYIPDKDNGNYRIFYLEKSFDFGNGPLWVLGTATPEGHSNYGDVDNPESPEKFADLIYSVIR